MCSADHARLAYNFESRANFMRCAQRCNALKVRGDLWRDNSVEKASGDSYSELLAALPNNDSRWVLLNAKYRTADGGHRSKLTLITWVPAGLTRASTMQRVKVKMTAVLHTKLLKAVMPGIVCNIHASDLEDLNPGEVLAKVSKFERELVATDAVDL